MPFRVLAALAYESFLVLAICLAATLPYVALLQLGITPLPSVIFQIYLIVVCGIYFVWCWMKSGQTLGLRTWNLKVVTESQKPLTLRKAILRYLIAIPCTLTFVSIIWMLFDKDNCLLHDRLIGTRIKDSRRSPDCE